MSAIFGIWHLNGQPVEPSHMQAMLNKVCHYGRDEQSIELQQNIGLGCCLNKWSLHSHAEVPIYSDETQDIMLIGDVQIYNWDELIHEHRLADNSRISKQALLLLAYKRWGEDCPRYLNGDFAFAIWEREKQQLLVIRDHLGVRPLFYFYNQATLAFATDYRALLALPFVSKQLNELQLYHLLSNTYHIDPEATYFAHIKKLRQAHLLQVSKNGIKTVKYWTPGTKKIIYKAEEEYAEALYTIVADAIRKRIHNTNANIGAELSGGIDSSVIVTLANRELRQQGKSLPLFSWSPSFKTFPQQPNDERGLIALLCRQEGMECTYYDPDMPLNKEVNNRTTPVEDAGSGVFQQELQVLSAQGVRWILTGWGGDQGISHRTSLFGLFVNGDWSYFLKEAHHVANRSPWRFCKTIVANTIMPMFAPLAYFGNYKGMTDILQPEFAARMSKHRKRDILYFNVNPIKHIESGNIQTRTELTAWLGADAKTQHVFPFLDYRVVDFAMSIPRRLYLKGGTNRYVYRRAFAELLPAEICSWTDKNDAARVACLHKIKDRDKGWKDTFTALSKDLFSPYLDWDKLTQLTASQDIPFERQKQHFIQKSVRVCYNVQRILAETKQR